MTMPHDWLKTWGEAIEPDLLSGPFAVRFRNFLTNEAAGLASISGARRHERSELVILDVETNRPQRPAYPILHREPVAVVLSDGTFAPAVLALRPDFPDTPHQNWVPDGVPFSLCIDDRPWQEARPLYTPAELLHRIMKWFERAGRGGLHDLRQPLDPFFMRQGVHIVMGNEPHAARASRRPDRDDGEIARVAPGADELGSFARSQREHISRPAAQSARPRTERLLAHSFPRPAARSTP
jgi:hypothetical protein